MKNICTFFELGKVKEAVESFEMDLMFSGRDLENEPVTEQELTEEIVKRLPVEDGQSFNLGRHLSGKDNILRASVDAFGINTQKLIDDFQEVGMKRTNVSYQLTTFDVADIFHGMPSALEYFKGRTNRLMAIKTRIGEANASTYVESNETVSKNLQHLKNELFVNIQNFLVAEGLLDSVEELFDDNYMLKSYENYEKVIQTATKYFYSGNFDMLTSYTNKKIPNIVKNNKITSKVYEVYSDLVFLNNFDTVVKDFFGHTIKINGNYLDSIEGSPVHDKYYVKHDPKSTPYWSNDSHIQESVSSLDTEAARMIINTIPAFDRVGNQINTYMDTNDMYLLAAVIADFELNYGNKAYNDSSVEGFDYLGNDTKTQLDWYINNILDVVRDGNVENPLYNEILEKFENYVNIAYSLDSFFNDPNLNIAQKESNAEVSLKDLFGQILNNSYGATYHIYTKGENLSEYQVYSQDFSSTGLQKSILSKMITYSQDRAAYSMFADSFNKEDFEDIFEDIELSSKMSDAITQNPNFADKIINFIHDKTGIVLDTKNLLDMSVAFGEGASGRNAVTVQLLKNSMSRFVSSLNNDFIKNIAVKAEGDNAVDDFEDLNTKLGNMSTGTMITETINSKFYKVMAKTVLSRFPIKSIMNITTHSGEAIPAYKIANLTYKDTDLYRAQREYEKNLDNTYKNLFLEGDSPIIKGTSIKLEVVDPLAPLAIAQNKRGDKVSPKEHLIVDVKYGFLDSLADKDNPRGRTFNVMIGNYADKSTIISKMIDGDWKINDEMVRLMDMDTLVYHVRSQAANFYTDALNKVFKDYTELFEANNIYVENELSIDNFENSVETINKLLQQHKEDTGEGILDLIYGARDTGLKITKELHYSSYNGNSMVNQVLADNYRIFTDSERFKKFKDIQETNFVQKIYEQDADLSFLKEVSPDMKSLLGLNPKANYSELVNSDLELNPILQKWMWMNALARNEYLFMSTKGEYMHPGKANVRYMNLDQIGDFQAKLPTVHSPGDTLDHIDLHNFYTQRITTEKEASQTLSDIAEESPNFKISSDENYYDYVGDIPLLQGLSFTRVSNFVDNSEVPTNINVNTALEFGNRFDLFARDFFDDNVDWNNIGKYKLGDLERTDPVVEGLEALKQSMEDRGEKILAHDVTLYDKELMIAGTVDLLTYDGNGDVRVYDFKTMKDDNFKTYYYEDAVGRKGNPISKYDSTLYGPISKREQHRNQLSLYAMMLNNTYGLNVVETAIIPVNLEYSISDDAKRAVEYADPKKIKTVIDKEIGKMSLDPAKMQLLDIVKMEPKATIRSHDNRVAKFKNYGTEFTNFDTRTVQRNPDKLYIYANNDSDTDQIKGLPNTIGISVQKSTGTPPPVKTVDTIEYKIKGRKKPNKYRIDGNIIYNEKNKPVFTEDSADRTKIYAKYRVANDDAVVVTYKGHKYTVNRQGKILSDSSGKFVYEKESIARKTILEEADQLFEDIAVTNDLTIEDMTDFTFEDSDDVFNNFKKHVDSVIQKALATGKDIVVPTAMGKEYLPTRFFDYLDIALEDLKMGNTALNDSTLQQIASKDFAVNFSDSYWQGYMNEVSNRLTAMSKRNVTNTSTFETAVKRSLLGSNPNVNIAIVDDFVTNPYSITGEKQYEANTNDDGDLDIKMFQDAHDGYSFLNSVYSKLVDAAYPGKGYEGTKKRFGTLVFDNAVAVKKDSEGEITNERIRMSTNSEIDFRSMQKKMLGVSLEGMDLNYYRKFGGDFYFDHLGEFYKINELNLQTNDLGEHNLSLKLARKVGGTWAVDQVNLVVDSLHEIWEAIGGEFSKDSEGNWTEGSNELLYDIVVHTENTNSEGTQKGDLKDKMIHIVSNSTAFKAGATNMNASTVFTDPDRQMLFAEFVGDFLGVQLDATHEMNDSEINEVTQMISALVQNGYTSGQANEVYRDIKNAIQEASKPYIKHLHDLNDINSPKAKDEFLDYLSHNFIKSVEGSERDTIAKVLIQNLKKDGIKIPFSNQNFHNAFVKDIITRMNTDFISRKYPGIGATLAASEGIIQMFDVDITNPDGTITEMPMTQQDVMTEALNNYVPGDFMDRHGRYAESNYEIIQDFIDLNITNKTVRADEVEIGDNVEVEGVTYSLTTPEQYYKFKDSFGVTESVITKIRTIPRNLKPTLHSFEFEGTKKNVFDLTPVRLRYMLTNLKNRANIRGISEADKTMLKKLATYVQQKYRVPGVPFDHSDRVLQNIYGTQLYKVLNNFLHNWTQRNLSLLDHKLTMLDVDENTDFDEYFKDDDLMVDISKDVIKNYQDNIVDNITFRNAELVLGDMYKNIFRRSDNESVYHIQKQGPEFFANKLRKEFKVDNTDADYKILSKKSNTPIYVKYVQTLPQSDATDVKIVRDWGEKNESKKAKYVRRANDGTALYRLPSMDNIIVKRQNNSDVIYIKWSMSDSESDVHDVNKHFMKNNHTLLKSFGKDLQTVVPLMRDNSKMNVIDKNDRNRIDPKPFDLNEVTANLFKQYMELDFNIPLVKHSIFTDDSMIQTLGNRMFASWQKSLEVVASRIPAQSMQSFMPMKNIAYNAGTKNDAYVSISQIFLQGSDFDIDKAYIMGYSFNDRGNFDTWSKMTSYSKVSQLNELNKLPKATGNTDLSIKTIDMSLATQTDSTFLYDLDLANLIAEFGGISGTDYNVNELSSAHIEVMNRIIRHINSTGNDLTVDASLDPYIIQDIVDLVNKHNEIDEDIDNSNALKNKVVSGIQSIISAPSNQLLANSPITIQNIHDIVDQVEAENAQYNKTTKWKEDGIYAKNSPYDMMSYYVLQQDASVGKEDVGIAANGVKAFFALTDYYNGFFDSLGKTISGNELAVSNELFEKNIEFYLPGGRVIQKVVNTIADIQLGRNNREALKRVNENHTPNYSNAALILSGLLSAATDNAKELLMARINATPELFSMHLYLAVLGLDMKEIVEIMTSPTANELKKLIDQNIFDDSMYTSVEAHLNNMAENAKGTDRHNIETFKDIYRSSKEFSSLAGFLGVNQKRKANPWEVYNYLAKFENIFNKTSDSIIKDRFSKSETFKEFMANKGGGLDQNYSIDWIAETIVSSRPILKDQIHYVKRVVGDSIDLIYDGLDFRKYFKDESYKQRAIEYYNLVKHTFNIFDVVEKVPHFKGMIDSLVLTHEMLLNASERYNFVYGIGKDAIHKGKEFDPDFNKSYISQPMFTRISDMFNMIVTEQWLQEEVSHVNLDLKTLMENAGVTEYVLYLNEGVKDHIRIEGSDTTAMKVRTDINDGTRPIIRLDSPHGIAMFKRVMEDLIIPTLQKTNKSEFINSLRVEEVTNPFGIKSNALVSTHSLQDLKSLNALAQFESLINDFDSLDSNNDMVGLLKNNVGNSLKIRDLMFLYNLLVHKEKYGNKKLTPILENYMKEPENLGYKYIKHFSEIDRGSIDIFRRHKEAHGTEWRNEALKNIFYHINQRDGQVSIKEGDEDIVYSISNPHITSMVDVSPKNSVNRIYNTVSNIATLIREKGWAVTLEC